MNQDSNNVHQLGYIWVLISLFFLGGFCGQVPQIYAQTYAQDVQAMKQLWESKQLYVKMTWITQANQQTSEDVVQYWKKGTQYAYTFSSTSTQIVGDDQIEVIIHPQQQQIIIHPKSSNPTILTGIPDSTQKILEESNIKITQQLEPKGMRIYQVHLPDLDKPTYTLKCQAQNQGVYPIFMKFSYAHDFYGVLHTSIQYQDIQPKPIFPPDVFQALQHIVATKTGYQATGKFVNYQIIWTGHGTSTQK